MTPDHKTWDGLHPSDLRVQIAMFMSKFPPHQSFTVPELLQGARKTFVRPTTTATNLHLELTWYGMIHHHPVMTGTTHQLPHQLVIQKLILLLLKAIAVQHCWREDVNSEVVVEGAAKQRRIHTKHCTQHLTVNLTL